jgi:hypothetical protein
MAVCHVDVHFLDCGDELLHERLGVVVQAVGQGRKIHDEKADWEVGRAQRG